MKCRFRKLQFCFAAAVVCAVTVAADLASAQAPARPRNFGRPSTPSISPNLMLLNRNNSFDYNYLSVMGANRRFNQVEQQYGRELDSLERQFYQNRLPSPEATIGPQNTSITGHPTGYFNYGSYYRMGPR